MNVMDPLFLLICLTIIPVTLFLGKMCCLKDCILRIWRKHAAKLPFLQHVSSDFKKEKTGRKFRLLQKGHEAAKKQIELLEEHITQRKCTISELRAIANELDFVNTCVDVTKLSSTAVAVGGGLVATTSALLSLCTCGIATPLFTAGVAMSASSGIVTAGTDVLGSLISKQKLHKAQKTMDKEKNLIRKIKLKEKVLNEIAMAFSNITGITAEESFLLFFFYKQIQQIDFRLSIDTALLMIPIVALIFVTFARSNTKYTAMPISIGIAKAVGSATLTFVRSTGKALLKSALGVALLAWDIGTLVQISISIHNGSKSKAAESLRKVARELKKQLEETKKIVKTIRGAQENFLDNIRKQLFELFQTVSDNGYATKCNAEEIKKFLYFFAPKSFCDALANYNMEEVAFHMARLTSIFKPIIDKKLEEEEEEKRKFKEPIHVTVISHGGLSSPFVPSELYCITPLVESVNLYSPWGCAIDANVAYAIATGTIHINRLKFSCSQNEILPHRPVSWNNLVKSTMHTPGITLTPVSVDEAVWRDMIKLQHIYQFSHKGLVIPYFDIWKNGLEGPTLVEAPLWVLCCIIGIIVSAYQRMCHIHVACCLNVDKLRYPDLVDRETNHVRQTTYCTVPLDPLTTMSHALPLYPVMSSLNALNQIFLNHIYR